MKSHSRHTFQSYIFCILGWFLFLLVGVLVWTEKFSSVSLPPCLFHLATGYYCPGCGGTRAVKKLFQGHLFCTLLYHPAVLYGVFLFLRVLIGESIGLLRGGRLARKYQMRKRDVCWIVFLTMAHFLLLNGCKFFYGVDLLKAG